MAKARDWMEHAVKPSHRGLFTAEAKKAGMSVSAYAEKEKHAKGKLGKRARFALLAEGK